MQISRFLFPLSLCVVPLLAACESSEAPASMAETPATAPAADATTPSDAAAALPAETANVDMAPLFGTFAADLGWCDGEGDGFPVTITPTRFEGRENICEITALTDSGDGSFTADLSCTAAGDTVQERLVLEPVIAPTGEGVDITYVDRGGAEATLLRCD